MRLSTDQSLVPEEYIDQIQKRLLPEIENLSQQEGYKTEYASLHLPEDHDMHAYILQVADAYRDADIIVVAGIGGSRLGALAVHEAVNSQYHNLVGHPKIFFLDTVDADKTHPVLHQMEETLRKGGRVIVNGISKSGGTMEPLANFEVLIDVLAQHKDNWEKDVVVTTVRDSNFWKVAKEKGFTTLSMPDQVGGRYSVFTAVGLFPLTIVGVDTHELLKGAQHMKKQCLNPDIRSNPAALSAAILFHHLESGKNIADTFVFSTALEATGKWYRQLMGESIGKKHDRQGNLVNVGMTPTTSVGSVDLHSITQLTLGGPFDKVTTFVTLDHTSHLAVPEQEAYKELVPNIQGKQFKELMNAIFIGVQKAYANNNRPFMTITLEHKHPYHIGEFMQMKMMEMIYLAYLLNVNPFDQPSVEDYKKETKAILSQ